MVTQQRYQNSCQIYREDAVANNAKTLKERDIAAQYLSV